MTLLSQRLGIERLRSLLMEPSRMLGHQGTTTLVLASDAFDLPLVIDSMSRWTQRASNCQGLCFASRLSSERRVIATLGLLTAVALGVVSFLIEEGSFSRFDGLLLVAAWRISMVGMRTLTSEAPTAEASDRTRQVLTRTTGVALLAVYLATSAGLIVFTG